MAYYNRYKDVEIELPAIHGTLDGYFQLETFKGTEFPKGSGNVYEHQGTRRVLGAAEHDNLLLDYGLEQMGAYRTGSGWSSSLGTTGYGPQYYGHVGTGTSTPTVSQTALDSFVASAAWDGGGPALGLGAYWTTGTPPYYGSHRHKYRFSPGFAGGAVNLNEVGVGGQATTGGLSSRALTVNGSGVPTTVTVLADEYLDLYYTRRNYPGLMADESLGTYAEQSGTVDIDGITYNYTMRPIAVTHSDWAKRLFVLSGGYADSGFGTSQYQNGLWVYANASHAAITSTNMTSTAGAGNYGGTSKWGMGSYTANSYTRTLWYYADIDQCNVTSTGGAGFNGFKIMTNLGAYQVLLDGIVPKTSTKVYTYYHQWSWARH